MAITTCTVTGNIKTLLNSNVSDCAVTVSTLSPFFHGATWISGALGSVTSNASGDFSIGVIETETVGKKLSFTFEYFDGVANKRRKSYVVIVPNTATAALSDLVASETTISALPSYPASNVTVSTISGLVAENAQAAFAELQGDIDTLEATKLGTALVGGKILVGNASDVATAVDLSGDATLSNTGALTVANNAITNAKVSASAAVARSKLAPGTVSVVPVNDSSGVLTDSSTTATQLGYLDATSSIQTQLDAKQATGNYITALTGDVAASGPGSAAATIQAGVVSNSKLATMADQTFKGNVSGSTASPSNLTVSQMKTALNLTGTNSGDVTLAAVGAVPNANGASLSTQALTLQPADGSFPGVVTTAAQTFAGVKTFSSAPIITALSASLPLQLDASKNVTAAAVNLAGTQVTSTLPIAKGGTGQITAAAAFDALSPNTTKGDITAFGTTNARLALGTNGNVLTADSTQSLGVKWAPAAAGVTGNYFQGYTATGARWTTTSASFADPGLVAGANTLTSRKSSGLTVTAAASSVAGITWTPSSSSSVYFVTATFGMHNSSTGQTVSALLTDGTNHVSGQSIQEGTSDASAIFAMTLSGIFAPASGSAVTLKVQMAVGGGTGDLRDIGGLAGSIQWSVFQLV